MKNTFFKLSFALAIGSFAFVGCETDNNDNDDDKDVMQLYVSNNSNGDITIYDVEEDYEMETVATTSTMAEGIYYDADRDEIIQASRSSNQLNAYTDVSTLLGNLNVTASFSSSADLSSPRDIATNGNILVVADNADVDGDPTTADGRLFIYTNNNGSLSLRNTVTTDFAVWGIEFVGNDLYAIVDKTNMLAVYTNFAATNTTDATVSASKKIAIEGIVRTHGIAYDGGTMILTDVGDAASSTDGGFHIITDFNTKFDAVADGNMMVIAGNQVRVAGAATSLGNPVAAEYDAETNTVFIAEAANGGGKVLSFVNADAGGDLSPSMDKSLSKASSLYFYSK